MVKKQKVIIYFYNKHFNELCEYSVDYAGKMDPSQAILSVLCLIFIGCILQCVPRKVFGFF